MPGRDCGALHAYVKVRADHRTSWQDLATRRPRLSSGSSTSSSSMLCTVRVRADMCACADCRQRGAIPDIPRCETTRSADTRRLESCGRVCQSRPVRQTCSQIGSSSDNLCYSCASHNFGSSSCRASASCGPFPGTSSHSRSGPGSRSHPFTRTRARTASPTPPRRTLRTYSSPLSGRALSASPRRPSCHHRPRHRAAPLAGPRGRSPWAANRGHTREWMVG